MVTLVRAILPVQDVTPVNTGDAGRPDPPRMGRSRGLIWTPMDLAIRIERVVVFSEGHPPYFGRRPAGTVYLSFVHSIPKNPYEIMSGPSLFYVQLFAQIKYLGA